MYFLTLLVAFMCTINLSFAQGRGETCMDEDDYLEGGLVRKRNKYLNKPLYLLYFAEIADGADTPYGREYNIYVSSPKSYKGMNAVKIITKSQPYCGDGQFTFNMMDFDHTKDPNCTSVLESKSDEILPESPSLTWSPPLCGCVNFRAIVVYGKRYYKDDESVENGPLSQTICVEKQNYRPNHLVALCSAMKLSRGNTVVGDPYFLRRHGLDAMTVDGVKLLDSLQTRWGQINICCIHHMSIPEVSVDCMDDIRRRRIDNLCTNNLTDIPMVDYKVDHTLQRKTQCCHLQGMLKYSCFHENGQLNDITKDTLLDFSKEDTDPANDLAILAHSRWDKCFDKDLIKGACHQQKLDKSLLRYVIKVVLKPKTTNMDSYNKTRNETSSKKITDPYDNLQRDSKNIDKNTSRNRSWTCMDGYLDGTGARGRIQNKFKKWDEPMYTLNITEIPAGDDDVLRREYKVEVSSTNSSRVFNAVKIITSSHPYCGEGQFTFDSKDFTQDKDPNCDRVLEYKNQKKLTRLPPLTWSPPFCNCVKFRVIVFRGQYYFMDDQSVENGPLSQTICIKKQHDRLSYLKALCAATKFSSAINVIGNQFVLSRHSLEPMMKDGLKLMESLQSRWQQIRNCCIETTPGVNIYCMDAIRRRRIDRFCTFNLTDIPMVYYKFHHTWQRKEQCCRYQELYKGYKINYEESIFNIKRQQRYNCFGENVNITEIVHDTLLDFSNEDIDVANDLAIFGYVEDKKVDVLRFVTRVEFQEKTTSFDKYNDPFMTGSNCLSDTGASNQKQRKKAEKKLEKLCCGAGKHSSKRTCKTTKYLNKCEIGFKNFVSRRVISDFKVCESKFMNCCIKRRCCRAGRKYSSIIRTNDITKVINICTDGFWEDSIHKNIKSYLNICQDRFKKCCFKRTFKIS